MEPETMGTKLHEFTERQHDRQALTAADLQKMLAELHSLASEVHAQRHSDRQASTAKIDELRKQYTAWFDAAVAQERTSVPVKTLPAMEVEFCQYRDGWLEASGEGRSSLEADIIGCLARVEAQPDSEQLVSQIRTFLAGEAALDF